MGQTESKDNAQKVSWFTGLKAEFRKIIWPNQKSLVRQTAAVVAVSVVLGLVIALIDWVIQNGVNFLVGLSF
jgi:preprotein translocase subunit SecE